MECRIGSTNLVAVVGDLTRQSVDAVVNAANAHLAGGGGVDGAIHRAGGPEIMAECDRLRARQGGCPTGQAVLTTAGRLPARHVIHAVGPIWHGGSRGEAELLAGAYRRSFELARRHDLRSVALAALSTGVYGYPKPAATRIAVATAVAVVEEAPAAFDEIRFVSFSDEMHRLYATELERVCTDRSNEGS